MLGKFYNNQQGKFYIPTESQHRPAAQTIINGNIWEPQTQEWMKTCYKGGSIIHAGCYFGDALPFLSELAKNNTVWTFEPNNVNYLCALKTIIANNLNNVKIFNLALSDEEKILELLTQKDGILLGGASMIRSNGDQSCISIPLDDFIHDKKIGLIHLDIEHHEIHALQGSLKIITKHLPALIIEDLQQKLEKDPWMIEHIQSLGYQKKAYVHRNLILDE